MRYEHAPSATESAYKHGSGFCVLLHPSPTPFCTRNASGVADTGREELGAQVCHVGGHDAKVVVIIAVGMPMLAAATIAAPAAAAAVAVGAARGEGLRWWRWVLRLPGATIAA